jgi:thiol-disulfide isomerase/thioredoxin
MKKYCFLLLFIVHSTFATPKFSIAFSGKILNTENGKITVKGESFSRAIKVNPDGTFSENLAISYEGIYAIETSKNWMPIYLTKDSKISITADDANFAATLKYTGEGSAENQYILNKTAVCSKTSDEELFKLNENDFLNKIKEIIASVDNLYQNTKFQNTVFKQKEVLNKHYLEQIYFLFYLRMHNNYAKTYDYVPSNKFPKFDSTMDLDNETDFLFSTDYQDIVITKFFENIKGDGKSFFISAKDAIPEIKALKSQSIKNRLIQNSVYDITIENSNFEQLYYEYNAITNDPKVKETLKEFYINAKASEVGKPSPLFNYENHKGGTISLESLKGKYVFIDVWATWCGPCRQDLPFLQKIEEQFQGKNIVFVSISIDNVKDRIKWSNLVNEKQLGGIQLLADKEFESKFIKSYAINSIPRYILLDINGNIVNANAPRPTDPKLVELLNSLHL